MKIQTKRLFIRPYVEDDIYAYHNLKSQEDITYKAGIKPHPDLRTSEYRLQSAMFSNDYYAVTLHDGTFIGDVNFYPDPVRRPKGVNGWQIGFMLDKKYWGHGYMQEALKAFIMYLFTKYPIDILSAVTLIDNDKSIKTIESIGFKYDGIIRNYMKMYNGDIVDCKIFTMTQNEFERNVLLWQKN